MLLKMWTPFLEVLHLTSETKPLELVLNRTRFYVNNKHDLVTLDQ